MTTKNKIIKAEHKMINKEINIYEKTYTSINSFINHTLLLRVLLVANKEHIDIKEQQHKDQMLWFMLVLQLKIGLHPDLNLSNQVKRFIFYWNDKQNASIPCKFNLYNFCLGQST